MSHTNCSEPTCRTGGENIDLLISSREKDLGGFSVRRVLPSGRRQMVGPFIFFDHMGPATFPPGKGISVRPHPHIGLATITYLFEGQILHRDSLGYVQPIERGAVNLMTAGRGIVHSERAGDDLDQTSHLHGIQSWMALPEASEEIEPAFVHHPANTLPKLDLPGVRGRVIVGSAFGHTSPVQTHAQMLYLELNLAADAHLSLPDGVAELAVYAVSGEVTADGQALAVGDMAVAKPGVGMQLASSTGARVMVIGGEPLGPRHIWWNFVSSSAERIEQAKADWRDNRFDKVPGDSEFIPLPGS
ncbi:MAG: pirin family protein [Pseudomonadota bacterium]